MVDSFVFYKSFYVAIKEFDNDTIAEFFKLVCQYALDGEIIETNNKVAKALFQMTIPQIEANRKRRENGKKGGAPTGNNNAKKTTEKQPKNNQKQPKVDFKNNQKQPNVNVNVNDNGYNTPTNVVVYNQEEKKNNINIIPKKEKSFSDVFEAFKSELLGEDNEIWRETVTRKFGIVNHALALDEFKAHVIAQGNDVNVAEHKLNEFKAYFANLARMGIFSEATKSELKSKPKENKRKPCIFCTQRTGQGVIGVISQDGNTFYVPHDVGYPPTESHYWNPASKQYEVQQR